MYVWANASAADPFRIWRSDVEETARPGDRCSVTPNSAQNKSVCLGMVERDAEHLKPCYKTDRQVCRLIVL